MLLTLTLVLLVNASVIQANLFGKTFPGNDIDALCAGKTIDLTTFSQLKELGEAVGSSACSSATKEAISDLVDLTQRGKADLCSLASVNELKTYYAEYLDTSGANGKGDKAQALPESVKKFVIAYGMQMSNLCKKNMVNILSSEQGGRLADVSDFKHLYALIKDDGPVAQVLSAMGKPGEVFLPGDLIPLLKKDKKLVGGGGGRGEDDDRLVMQTSTAAYIRQINEVCQQRFKPVYKPLMMPVHRLANMGFNYRDKPLESDLECPEIVHDLARWSRIVFLCESLSNVRIIDEDQDDASSLIRILTPEEANAIEDAHPQLAAAAASAERDHEQIKLVADLDDELLETAISKVTTNGVMYNKSNKLLMNAVKSFNRNHNEEQILQQRMRKRGLDLLRKHLKSGRLGLIFSAAWKAMLRKGQAVDSTTKQLVVTLNEIAEQQQAGASDDGPVSSGAESAEMIVFQRVMLVLVCVIFISLVLGLVTFGLLG